MELHGRFLDFCQLCWCLFSVDEVVLCGLCGELHYFVHSHYMAAHRWYHTWYVLADGRRFLSFLVHELGVWVFVSVVSRQVLFSVFSVFPDVKRLHFVQVIVRGWVLSIWSDALRTFRLLFFVLLLFTALTAWGFHSEPRPHSYFLPFCLW